MFLHYHGLILVMILLISLSWYHLSILARSPSVFNCVVAGVVYSGVVSISRQSCLTDYIVEIAHKNIKQVLNLEEYLWLHN